MDPKIKNYQLRVATHNFVIAIQSAQAFDEYEDVEAALSSIFRGDDSSYENDIRETAVKVIEQCEHENTPA